MKKIYFYLTMFLFFLYGSISSHVNSAEKDLIYAFELLGPLQEKICLNEEVKLGMEQVELLKIERSLESMPEPDRQGYPKLLFGKSCQNNIIYTFSDDSSSLADILIKLEFLTFEELQEHLNAFRSVFNTPSRELKEVQDQVEFDALVWEFDIANLVLSYSSEKNYLLVRILSLDMNLNTIIRRD